MGAAAGVETASLYDLVILAVVLVFSLPVFAYSLYTVVLLFGSLSYAEPPRKCLDGAELPLLTVLLASYNEANVVGATLGLIRSLDYPSDRLQVVVADDSTDETAAIVDREIESLRDGGIDAMVSRRGSREGFKAGALNAASKRIRGDLVLLIDADSRVSSSALRAGIEAVEGGDLTFVSYRVGHYNRDESLVTRSFALFQDTVDGLQKMGSSRLSLPFSLQGGFVLARTEALAQAGFWREGILAEDADLSCRLFAAGGKGRYLSGSELLSEDPHSLRTWKRQAARVAMGWAQCLRADLGGILRSKDLSLPRKTGLLLTLLSPFAGLSWIVVTLLTAVCIVLGLTNPMSSVFSSPFYVAAVSLPAVVFYIAGVKALNVRKMLSARNLALLPVVSYMVSAMFTISAISYVRGLANRRGDFFRTPKSGGLGALGMDSQPGEGRAVRGAEGSLSVLSLALSIPMFLYGQLFLALSLLAFGAVTLKSMELTSGYRGKGAQGGI